MPSRSLDVAQPCTPCKLNRDRSAAELLKRGIATSTEKYGHSGKLEDLDVKIGQLRELMQVLEDDALAPDLDATRLELAQALSRKVAHTGKLDNVDEQIWLCHLVLEASASRDTRNKARLVLGTSLRNRFERYSSMEDIRNSIEHLERALEDTKELFSDYPLLQTELGRSLVRRYQREGHFDDLTRAVSLHRAALASLSKGNSYQCRVYFNLGSALLIEHTVSGDVAVLQESLASLEMASSLAKTDDPQRQGVVVILANALMMLYNRTLDICHLQRHIDYLREAQSLLPDGHDMHGTVLSNLTNGLGALYEAVGLPELLDEAIDYGTRSLLLRIPQTCPYFNTAQNLAMVLSYRAERTGNLVDLERSIKLSREAIDYLGPKNFLRGLGLSNMGAVLLLRFRLLGNDSDLDNSLDCLRACTAIFPPTHPDYVMTLTSLISALHMRYDISPSIRYLEEATELYETTKDHCPPMDRERIRFIYAAAGTFFRCFRALGTLHDLDQAKELYATVTTLRDDVCPQSYETYHELACALRERFRYLGDMRDAHAAEHAQATALDIIPRNHSDRSRVLSGMARICLMRGSDYFDPAKAVMLLSEALQDTRPSARVRVTEAIPVLQDLQVLGGDALSPRELCNIHRLAVLLLPQVACFGLDIRSRLRVLEQGENLALSAAAYALVDGKPTTALELLEEGRAVFWTQFLRLRASSQVLPPDIRQELTSLSRQIELGSRTNSTSASSDADKLRLETEAAHQRELARRLDTLIEDLRTRPGLERFMLSENYTTLSKAASRGPVLILVAGKDTSWAIILANSHAPPQQILLAQASETRLGGMVENLKCSNAFQRSLVGARGMKKVVSGNARPKDVLEDIWTSILEPIVTHMGLKPSSGPGRRRLWICATGPFVHLPLHAAGVYSAISSICLSDYFVSSYTPTLGALVDAQAGLHAPRRSDITALLVAVSAAQRWRALPHAENEVALIRSLIPSRTEAESASPTTQFLTSDNVLEQAPNASILHLACHGFVNSDNPLENGFVMQNDMLTISKLIELNLPKAFLAFLSACETARGNSKQPDQAVSLASTMLFVGFKSVVGTMWSMGDVDGPVVANKVYRRLFEGDSDVLNPDAIPYALDEAMQELRKNGLHWSRWAPYVHIGV